MLTVAERALTLAVAAVLTAGLGASAAARTPPGSPTADASLSRLLYPPSTLARPAPPGIAGTPGPAASDALVPGAGGYEGRQVVAPLPARPAAPEPPQQGCPPPKQPPGRPYVAKPQPLPAIADAALPAPLPPGAKATDLTAVAGKGIWATTWPGTQLDVPGLVARARAAGLQSIWVRTGGSRQGYYGQRFLPRLVPAAHAAGLSVVAWDFPSLSDPMQDVERARRALAAGIDAFAPDLETSAEGTYATPARIASYLSRIRDAAGSRPVAATVPRPTPYRLRTFPYAAIRPYADVFAPMVYWSCNEPGALVGQSLRELGRWLPVAPVGQAYDMGSEGGRRGLPTRAETWRFLDAARRGGAVGASLWTVEQTGTGQWSALADYPWTATPRP